MLGWDGEEIMMKVLEAIQTVCPERTAIYVYSIRDWDVVGLEGNERAHGEPSMQLCAYLNLLYEYERWIA
jgi:hypothetical protein